MSIVPSCPMQVVVIVQHGGVLVVGFSTGTLVYGLVPEVFGIRGCVHGWCLPVGVATKRRRAGLCLANNH